MPKLSMLRLITFAVLITMVMGAPTYKLLGSEAHLTEHMANVSATWTAISTADLKQYANIHINNNKQLIVNSRSERNELHRAGSCFSLSFLVAWYLVSHSTYADEEIQLENTLQHI